MFYRKHNEFDLCSKQKYKNLVRDRAVEEGVDDMQEVRGSNAVNFCISPLTIAAKLHNFTAFHSKIRYEISGEKTNLSQLILHIFPIFPRPGKADSSAVYGKICD